MSEERIKRANRRYDAGFKEIHEWGVREKTKIDQRVIERVALLEEEWIKETEANG